MNHRSNRYFPFFVALPIAILLASSAIVRAQEMIDNPQYALWAKQKVGSSITYAVETQVAGQDITGTLVQKLLEVTPDQVTVEATQTVQMMGQSRTAQPSKIVYKAKIPKSEEPQTKLPRNMKGSIKEVGEEDLDVAGKSIHCKVAEFEGTMQMPQNPTMKGKIWRSDQVPGGLVKWEGDMQGAAVGKMSMTLKSMDLK
jgi:hypothetical protein